MIDCKFTPSKSSAKNSYCLIKKKHDMAFETDKQLLKQKKQYEKNKNKILEAAIELKASNSKLVFIPVGNGERRNRGSVADILRATEGRAARLSAERKAKAIRDTMCDQADPLRFALEGGWDI